MAHHVCLNMCGIEDECLLLIVLTSKLFRACALLAMRVLVLSLCAESVVFVQRVN